MIRLRMKTTESGIWPGWLTGSYWCSEGQEYEVPNELALAWLEKGLAERVQRVIGSTPPPVETSTEGEE